MDNTPNYANSPVEQKPSRKKTIWLVLVILALIASNTGWALFYLKQQGELTAQVNTLKAQNIKLTKDNKDLQSKDDSVDTTVYREIPELGVKYKVTDQTKDLTYAYTFDTKNSGAAFSTTAIIDSLNKSGSDGGQLIAALNASCAGQITLYKPGDKDVSAAGASTPIEQVKDAKKVGSNYFTYSHGQSTCSDDKTINAQADKAMAATLAAFNSLKPIQ